MRLQGLTRLVRLCGILTLAIPLASCQTTMGSSVQVTKVACQVFNPITWSKKDTVLTVAQVKEYNAAGKELCGWK
jgi:hypothetical protein